MQDSLFKQMPAMCPRLHWRPLVWLATSPVAPAEVGDELRASMFNRMPSLVASALTVFAAAVAVAVRHPQISHIAWAILEATASVVRISSAISIVRARAGHPEQVVSDKLAPDINVLSGLIWCSVLGYGSGLCLASGDLGVSVVGCLLAIGTIGAQCGRMPATPRLMVAQLLLIGLPLTLGGFCAPDPFLRWGIFVVPVYLAAIGSINRQLHRDYVEMVVGRHESRLMALRCPLTGLANRRAFDRALATALSASVRARARAVIVLSLDLDGFKSVNDARGHLAGDLLLRQVGERLASHVPAGCLVARLGGDEFAILAQGAAAAAAAAEQLACALLAALREPFLLSGSSASVGVSIGLAHASAVATPDRLLGEADEALYAAKRAGKNRYCWFGGEGAVPDLPALEPAGPGQAKADRWRGTIAPQPSGKAATPPLILSGDSVAR